MPHHQEDAVYSYVERAYIRMQAGELLMRCLEDGNPLAIQQMVESLVLAGPQSLTILKEIIAEAGQRESQLKDDLNQIMVEMENNLRNYGVSLPVGRTPKSFTRTSTLTFMKMVREQNFGGDQEKAEALQILKNSKELLKGILANIRLLEEIERYINDWLWGLAYQSTRQDNQVS
jgi:hypothetical protein